VYETDSGFKERSINVPLIGDNAVQEISIKQDNGK
jgi:hypothetical protein